VHLPVAAEIQGIRMYMWRSEGLLQRLHAALIRTELVLGGVIFHTTFWAILRTDQKVTAANNSLHRDGAVVVTEAASLFVDRNKIRRASSRRLTLATRTPTPASKSLESTARLDHVTEQTRIVLSHQDLRVAYILAVSDMMVSVEFDVMKLHVPILANLNASIALHI
jgi:hypothetical protein